MKRLMNLLFFTVACVVLQEASGRITVPAGKELGAAIGDRFADATRARWVPALLTGGVVLCRGATCLKVAFVAGVGCYLAALPVPNVATRQI
jgi:Mn2+/Fe2+ NRAMP family transporter